MRLHEIAQIDELNIDNRKGVGQTPNNSNVGYTGLTVYMKPDTFLKLATAMPEKPKDKETIAFLMKHEQSGGGVGAPTLYVSVPDEWREEDFSGEMAQITGHEGRHRMAAHNALYGNTPVETHLFLSSPHREWRNRYITPAIINELNRRCYSERDIISIGPFFDASI